MHTFEMGDFNFQEILNLHHYLFKCQDELSFKHTLQYIPNQFKFHRRLIEGGEVDE